MEVTILQTDIAWCQPSANMEKAARLMGSAPGSDLYVLPEMWTTGFATDPHEVADGEGAALEWMLRAARLSGAAVCGSVAVHDAVGYHNRLYMAKPDGSHAYYDKRHLFGYGGESLHYTAGDSRVVVEHGGMRWLLITCYDLRFPVWCRYRGDYDGMIVVANWPGSRRQVWDVLLRARAIENQCCVVAANRVGDDPACHYDGGSCTIDAKGRVLASCADGEEMAATATIDIKDIQQFREKFNVLDDRDKNMISQ